MADEIDDGFDDDSGAVAAFDAVFNPPADGAQAAAPPPATPEQPAAPVAAAPAPTLETPPQPVQDAPQVQPGQPAQAAAPSQPQAQAPAAPAAQSPQPTQAAHGPDGLIRMGNMLAESAYQRLWARFPEGKTDDDLLNLMRTDQGRYNEYAVAKYQTDLEIGRIGQFIQQQQQTAESAKTAAEGERMKARAETSKKIGELIPDLLKPDVAPKLSADMTAYARANEVPPGRYVDATAGEVNILYKAMQYDAAKASEAAAIKTASEKASKAPPVQQPGTRVPGDARTEKMQESFTNLQKFGRDEDATAIFANLLG